MGTNWLCKSEALALLPLASATHVCMSVELYVITAFARISIKKYYTHTHTQLSVVYRALEQNHSSSPAFSLGLPGPDGKHSQHYADNSTGSTKYLQGGRGERERERIMNNVDFSYSNMDMAAGFTEHSMPTLTHVSLSIN